MAVLALALVTLLLARALILLALAARLLALTLAVRVTTTTTLLANTASPQPMAEVLDYNLETRRLIDDHEGDNSIAVRTDVHTVMTSASGVIAASAKAIHNMMTAAFVSELDVELGIRLKSLESGL